MRTCPTCNKHYEDFLKYCIVDGTPLPDLVGLQEISNEPSQYESTAELQGNNSDKNQKDISTPISFPRMPASGVKSEGQKKTFGIVETLNRDFIFGKVGFGIVCGAIMGAVFVPVVSIIARPETNFTTWMKIKSGALSGITVGLFYGLVISAVFEFIGNIQHLKLPKGVYGTILGAILGISLSVIIQYVTSNHQSSIATVVGHFHTLGGNQTGGILFGGILGFVVDILCQNEKNVTAQ